MADNAVVIMWHSRDDAEADADQGTNELDARERWTLLCKELGSKHRRAIPINMEIEKFYTSRMATVRRTVYQGSQV
jgi:hypothetical protein